MANLNEIDMPEEGDSATYWAAWREFELRYTRYERAKKGVVHFMTSMTQAARRFTEAIQGLERVGK